MGWAITHISALGPSPSLPILPPRSTSPWEWNMPVARIKVLVGEGKAEPIS